MTENSDTAEEMRIPVTIVTGFLGSGKTTLLNRLLQLPDLRNVAVIVNEFGEVALDQYFLNKSPKDVVALPNGCLCCMAGDDFEDALARLFAARDRGNDAVSRILVETSGLADPAPIAQIVMNVPLMDGYLSLDSIVCTVDATHFERQLAGYEECRKQVALADQLIVTKSDLVDRGKINTVLGILFSRNRHASVLVPQLDAEEIMSFLDLGDSASPLDRSAMVESIRRFEESRCRHSDHDGTNGSGAGHAHSHSISSFSIVDREPVDRRAFDAWFRRLRRLNGDGLLRFKGILNFADRENPTVIHAIHHVAHPPVSLDSWPDDDRSTRMVFITAGIPAELIQEEWKRFRREMAS